MAHAARKLDVQINFARQAPLATLTTAFAQFLTGNFVQVLGSVITIVITMFAQPGNWVHIMEMALRTLKIARQQTNATRDVAQRMAPASVRAHQAQVVLLRVVRFNPTTT